MNKIADKTGYRAKRNEGVFIPSRLQLTEYLRKAGKPVSLEKISAAFELRRDDEIQALRGRLNRLVARGVVLLNRKNKYGLVEKTDLCTGKVLGHTHGFGFVIPDDGGDDLYLHNRQMRKVLHGDRVLACVKRIDHKGRKEGAIVEVLEPVKREIIGHFHDNGGVGFVEPDDPRFARDITIAKNRGNGAESGDIVNVKITHHPIEHHHAVGEVIEVLGREFAPGMETEIAVRKHGIPHIWSEDLDAELESIPEKPALSDGGPKRVDIRTLPLVTIDGPDARDFDDAVYCEKKGGGWRLIVAIADVSHYVSVDSALDREAYKRGNSVYFPNRVVPMLPEALSNGICSLRPNEDRYCLVCDMDLNEKGELVTYVFYPAAICSRAGLTYETVFKIVVEKDAELRRKWREIVSNLDLLYRLYRLLRKNREIRGAVDFEIPEPCIEFDGGKKITKISAKKRNDAHKLIEECMLAANVCAAKFLQRHYGRNSIYRNHEGPDKEALIDLKRSLKSLGLTLKGGGRPTAGEYASLLLQIETRPEMKSIVQTLLLRSLGQAVYSADQTGHFALRLPIYTHFTSPIRRYSDLIVHRQIKHALDGNKRETVTPEGAGFHQVGKQCSFTERRADDAAYDVIAWLKAEFMQDKVGETFTGKITGVKEFGMFVQLDEIFVDGLVHISSLGNDYYHFDPLKFLLTGERSGRQFGLGDAVCVTVTNVNLNEAKIDFELTRDARYKKSIEGKNGKMRNRNKIRRPAKPGRRPRGT